MKLTERQLQRVLQDKKYWVEIAAGILAEHPQNAPRETDSAIAEIGSMSQSLGRIHESRLLQRTPVRFRLVPGSGPRSIPMIAEVETVSPERGVLLSQTEAMRLRRQWDIGRLRGQEQVQHLAERGDAAGGEEEEEGDNPIKDHPGKPCSDAHAGMSHDDFLDKQEEEEERLSPRIHGRRHFSIPARRES